MNTRAQKYSYRMCQNAAGCFRTPEIKETQIFFDVLPGAYGVQKRTTLVFSWGRLKNETVLEAGFLEEHSTPKKLESGRRKSGFIETSGIPCKPQCERLKKQLNKAPVLLDCVSTEIEEHDSAFWSKNPLWENRTKDGNSLKCLEEKVRDSF